MTRYAPATTVFNRYTHERVVTTAETYKGMPSEYVIASHSDGRREVFHERDLITGVTP